MNENIEHSDAGGSSQPIRPDIQASTSSTVGSDQAMDESAQLQLQEYLTKFIELVPDLKEKNREEKIRKILHSAQNQAPGGPSIMQQLENLQNLEISSKSISDLQILQSVMDYIGDLQNEIVCPSNAPSNSN